ncbi:MAG: tetratricopeptide repeat protein [Bacteroidales bacterium]|nr:tetratricopeptide repeat protein [Bacteroidales bacterium]MCF8336709.1 tetratricopeptide repeat protein [Bacteroidales bacterium]
MAKKKKKSDRTEEQMQAVEGALSNTEQFIENNQKLLTTIVAVIILAVLGYFGFNKFYMAPKQEEAKSQMFKAEKYFEQDSLDLALNGDGQYPGFLQIIDDYGMTKHGNLAHYYAGVCYLKKGNYNKAISHLEDFDGDETIVEPWAIGKIGDAYMQLGEMDKAVDYYLEAAKEQDNNFTSPHFLMKAGMTYEVMDKPSKAREVYKKIKDEYPESEEYKNIDKYIARTEG